MLDVIKNANKNGFNVKTMNKDINLVGYKTSNGDQDFYIFSLYHLVFATDFVDKLVGEEVVCYLTKEKCVVKDCSDYIHGGIMCVEQCAHLKLCNLADYHLQQMARPEISRDIEKLKAYLRGLV